MVKKARRPKLGSRWEPRREYCSRKPLNPCPHLLRCRGEAKDKWGINGTGTRGSIIVVQGNKNYFKLAGGNCNICCPPTHPPLTWTLKLPDSTSLKCRESTGSKKRGAGPTYCWGVNDPDMGYSTNPVTLQHGVGVPMFQEDGKWACYSNHLVPKSQHLHTNCFTKNRPYNYHIKPKGRVPRPKSGQNSMHKGHGISKLDRLNGFGKIIPCEVPCRRKTHSSSIPISNSVITSKLYCLPTIYTPNTISTIHTNFTSDTFSTTYTKYDQVFYPKIRTKLMKTHGATIRSGGQTTTLPTVNLNSSSSTYSRQVNGYHIELSYVNL